jgi:LmbE family N-acetylglucosaminyl deacetylase
MKKENILIICAHSDDHILGVGGTIARYAHEGKKVHVIILSYGEKTHLWLQPRFAKELRERETRHADQIVGCKSTFFNLTEGKFKEGYPEIKQDLIKILKKEKPTKIFTHTNEDPHPDHKTTHRITFDILKTTRQKPELYLFSIWNPFSLKKSHAPRMYVDTTNTYSQKIAAIKHFRSQRPALVLLLWGIFARELKNGLHIGTKLAESFYRVQ